MSDIERLAAIIERFSARNDVAAAWLFGSEAGGRATSQSDVDVAVLFRAPNGIDDHLRLRGELEEELGRSVDLVDMRECSPLLAMQVVRSGRLLSDRDPVARANFVASLPSRRYDLLRVRRAAEQRLLERMARGRA